MGRTVRTRFLLVGGLALWGSVGCGWLGSPSAPKPRPGHLVVSRHGREGHVGQRPHNYAAKRYVTPYDYRTLPDWGRLVLYNRALAHYRRAGPFAVGLGTPWSPPGPGLTVYRTPAGQVTAVAARFPPSMGQGPWLKRGREVLHLVDPRRVSPQMGTTVAPALTRATFWTVNPILGYYHVIGRRGPYLAYAPNGPGIHFWLDRTGHVVNFRVFMPAAIGWRPWDDEPPGQPRQTRFGAVYTETLFIQVPPGFNEVRGPTTRAPIRQIPRPRAP